MAFVLLNDEELDELISNADSLNTKKQIAYGVGRLRKYAEFAGTTFEAVEAMSAEELDQFLSRFYAGLRKADGTLYTKKSMQGIKYGLHRHFKTARDIDIMKSDKFPKSNEAYKAFMVKLKQAGKGSVKHKKAISKEDMAKIFSSDALDITTPLGLQNKVFMDLMIYFANRGRENLRDMKAEDFVVQTNEQNLRYITHRDMLTKSRREDDDEEWSGFMYEIPGSPRCPVTTFLAYQSVLNPSLDCLWQRPKDAAPAEGPWYMNAPLGVNTLGNKMKDISEAAGCSKKYTNHCLRATTVTVLDRAGFVNRDIMSVTGHRSESSLKHYVSTSDDRKKQMSGKIARKMMQECQENSPTASSTNENVPSTSKSAEPVAKVAKVVTPEDPLNDLDSLLTSSQEQLVLQESNFNIQNAATSTVQHFHFHGPVTFYNN